MLTQRIGQCCFFLNTFPIMNSDEAWFVGPLGQTTELLQSLFCPLDWTTKPLQSFFSVGWIVQVILDRLFWSGSKYDCQVHICLKEPSSGRKCTKFWNLHLHQAQIQPNRGQWCWKEVALDPLSLSRAEDTHCPLQIHSEHTDDSGLFSFHMVSAPGKP